MHTQAKETLSKTHELMHAHTWVKTSLEPCPLAKVSRERGPGFLFFLSVPFVKLLQVLQQR